VVIAILRVSSGELMLGRNDELSPSFYIPMITIVTLNFFKIGWMTRVIP
jgi:hypothetical protein